MKNDTNTRKAAENLEKELIELIYQNNEKYFEYVAGLYRFMAKIDSLINVLIKKQIITKEEILKEQIPILKWMKKDFTTK